MSAPAPVLRRSARNATKRDAPATNEPAAAPAPKKKRTTKEKATGTVKKAAAAVKSAVTGDKAETKETTAAEETKKVEEPEAAKASAKEALKDGDALPDDLPEITTHSGETTTLKKLVDAADKGIVIFAYPKASTPGCTTQACAFRDSTAQFKDVGYAIYGLSGDSPAANEKFKTKQNLADITLLCDPKYELHDRFGIKKGAKGTIRSVIVISKTETGAVVTKKSPASPALSVEISLKAIGVAPNASAKELETKK